MDKKKDDMIKSLKPIQKETTRALQVEIPDSLWSAFEEATKKNKHSKKEAAVFGIRGYLLVHSPLILKKYGLDKE